MSVYAFDNYFTGALMDSVTGMRYTLGSPKYAVSDVWPLVPSGGNVALSVTTPTGGAAASPSQTGFLLLYPDGRLGKEAAQVIVTG